MRSDVVVVVSPQCQFSAGIIQAVEHLFVQAFITQAAIEAFDERVLLRLSRIDVMPLHFVVVRPFQDGTTGELGSVVADDLLP